MSSRSSRGLAIIIGLYGTWLTPVYGADIYVDTSWTFDEINAILDGNPATLGKNGHPDVSTGDIVHFASGTYTVPPRPGGNTFFKLYVPGVELRGQDRETTILQADPAYSSPIVFVVYVAGATLRNFTFLNEHGLGWGIIVSTGMDPTAPVRIHDNTFSNMERSIVWISYTVDGDNSQPSIIVSDNYFHHLAIAAHFNDSPDIATSAATAWAVLANNTFERITLLVYEPPAFCTVGPPCDLQEIGWLGLCQFDGNVIVDSDGAVMPQEVFEGVCPLPSIITAGSNTPDANGEWQDCLNPTLYPCVSTLAAAWGGYNFVGDTMFNWARRPLPGSPLIGSQYKNIDGSTRGYGGANPPAGDVNGDGLLTDYDQSAMVAARTGPGAPAPMVDRVVFDFDGDTDIDNDDLLWFLQGYVGNAPAIPATSTWGLIVIALSILCVGSAILRAHRPTT